jgi:hypothetical protein
MRHPLINQRGGTMEVWQMVMAAVGGVCLVLYFKRRAARLTEEE